MKRPSLVTLVVLSGAFASAQNVEIRPFKAHVPETALRDLKRRLAQTRWPDRGPGLGWTTGVPLASMKALAAYWQKGYDWRRFERKINAYPQFTTKIDGVQVHFIHVRSKHKGALPLILTHGWPGSIAEFLDAIGPLTNPTRYGGKAEDAFDVVIPSMPGFGFSGKPTGPGWNVSRTARAWSTLMGRLGYRRWVAQGGDWGAGVTSALGVQHPAGLAGIHLNFAMAFPDPIPTSGLSFEEKRAVDDLGRFGATGFGYQAIMRTKPQTLGYALADSPVGQAAWIYEKFQSWTDPVSRDKMLDDITLYWLTDTGASSARIYLENAKSSFSGPQIDLPVAVSVFPHEIFRTPKSWAQQKYPNLIYWGEPAHGGHFAAYEQPGLFVNEVRNAFRSLRHP